MTQIKYKKVDSKIEGRGLYSSSSELASFFWRSPRETVEGTKKKDFAVVVGCLKATLDSTLNFSSTSFFNSNISTSFAAAIMSANRHVLCIVSSCGWLVGV